MFCHSYPNVPTPLPQLSPLTCSDCLQLWIVTARKEKKDRRSEISHKSLYYPCSITSFMLYWNFVHSVNEEYKSLLFPLQCFLRRLPTKRTHAMLRCTVHDAVQIEINYMTFIEIPSDQDAGWRRKESEKVANISGVQERSRKEAASYGFSAFESFNPTRPISSHKDERYAIMGGRKG